MFYFKNIFFYLKKLICFNNYKLFSITKFMIILALLISIRIIFNFFSISISQFGMTISIAWVPLIIIGWLFGPLTGLFIGAVTDTICFFISPSGQWFWMYAIQEPLVGLISGFFSFFYSMSLNKENGNKLLFSKKQFVISSILFQIILTAFVLLTFFIVIFWLNDNAKFQEASKIGSQFYDSSKYILISLLLLFFIIFEFLYFIFIKKKKYKIDLIILYSTLLVLFNTFLFSFILGPISSISYFEYINKKPPSSFLKYGYIFYLIPRVIKESIKSPLEILILFSILPIIQKDFNLIKQNLLLKW